LCGDFHGGRSQFATCHLSEFFLIGVEFGLRSCYRSFRPRFVFGRDFSGRFSAAPNQLDGKRQGKYPQDDHHPLLDFCVHDDLPFVHDTISRID